MPPRLDANLAPVSAGKKPARDRPRATNNDSSHAVSIFRQATCISRMLWHLSQQLQQNAQKVRRRQLGNGSTLSYSFVGPVDTLLLEDT